MSTFARIAAIAAAAVITVSTLSGCDAESMEKYEAAYQEGVEQASEALAADQSQRGHFVQRVARDRRFTISYYRDMATDVMYVAYHLNYGGGLTMMYHPDGYPLRYSDWLTMSEGLYEEVE